MGGINIYFIAYNAMTLTVQISGDGMTQSSNVKAVLLSNEQVEKLRSIQEQERDKSALGVTPSIHAIARALMDRALKSACGEVVL